MTDLLDAPPILTPLPADPRATPLPSNRTLWRLFVHSRVWAANVDIRTTISDELIDARSVRVEQKLNQPSVLTFSIDGRSPHTLQLVEMQREVSAWRWDENLADYRPIFRGVLAHSEDEITEQAHTVNFTCQDFYGMTYRRFVTSPIKTTTYANNDGMVNYLLGLASPGANGAGVSFGPAGYLPLYQRMTNPDGSLRTSGSTLTRTRQYAGGQNIGEALANLAALQDGFDIDCVPSGRPPTNNFVDNGDYLRTFYPRQGIDKSNGDPILQFGVSVSTVTRTVATTDYANYVRVLGDNQSTDPNTRQAYSEANNADAITTPGVGVWQHAENSPDVSDQPTLDQQAAGLLQKMGLLVPSYTLTLRAGWWTTDVIKMGDTVRLIVQSGRLNVDTAVRVVGIAYAPSDDGGESVELTVGRPLLTLANIMQRTQNDIHALNRV